MEKESIKRYAEAVGALQIVQAAELGNKNQPAHGTLVKSVLSVYNPENTIRQHAEYEGHRTHTLNDGYCIH